MCSKHIEGETVVHINRILIVVLKRKFGSISDLKWYLSLDLPICVSNISMCLCIDMYVCVQTESYTRLAFFFPCVFCTCSTPCVTNLWSSCPTPVPAAQSSTSQRTTSLSSRLWCTKRPSSYRSYCLDTTWSVCVQCGCWMRSKLRAYVSCLLGGSCEKYRKYCSFLHILKQKVDLNAPS